MTKNEVIETIRTWIQTTDDEYDIEEQGRVYGLMEALELVKQIEPEQKWIPVSESERLPTDIVLLSLPPHIDPNGEECSASVICGHYIGGKDKEWGLSDGDTFGYGIVSVRKGTNPIAWMPLPKPYEPQESEDEDVEYQRQIEQLEHDILYEPTFNPEDGSM